MKTHTLYRVAFFNKYAKEFSEFYILVRNHRELLKLIHDYMPQCAISYIVYKVK